MRRAASSRHSALRRRSVPRRAARCSARRVRSARSAAVQTPNRSASSARPRASRCTAAAPAANRSTPSSATERREGTMPRQAITTDKAPRPGGHFAQAIAVEATGRLVFISGMVAQRPDGTIAGIGDIEAQTRQVCENVKAAVEAAGGTLADICRVDVYVRNMENLAPIHKVRREYFPSPPPASTLVEVSKFTHPDYLIEMSAIAVV